MICKIYTTWTLKANHILEFHEQFLQNSTKWRKRKYYRVSIYFCLLSLRTSLFETSQKVYNRKGVVERYSHSCIKIRHVRAEEKKKKKNENNISCMQCKLIELLVCLLLHNGSLTNLFPINHALLWFTHFHSYYCTLSISCTSPAFSMSFNQRFPTSIVCLHSTFTKIHFSSLCASHSWCRPILSMDIFTSIYCTNYLYIYNIELYLDSLTLFFWSDICIFL